MASEVEYSAHALRDLRKLDRQTAGRIVDYMDATGALEDPRARGRGLTGDKAGVWRYRMGDYRILCKIDDDALTVLVLTIAHRSSAYRRR